MFSFFMNKIQKKNENGALVPNISQRVEKNEATLEELHKRLQELEEVEQKLDEIIIKFKVLAETEGLSPDNKNTIQQDMQRVMDIISKRG